MPKDPLPVGLSEIPALRGSTFTLHREKLLPGDWLYFSTDGYTDQLGGDYGKRLGIKRFRELLHSLSTVSSAVEQKQVLYETHVSWRAHGRYPQVDDILVVGLQIPTLS